MDNYFGSIGFSQLQTKEQIRKIGDEILETPDSRYILSQNVDNIFIEYYKEYAENIGISVKGTMSEKEEVTVENIKPYCFTNNILTVSDVEIDDSNDEYIVICEEESTGNDIVFFMQNTLDFVDSDLHESSINKVNVVGLSTYGTVILPVEKDIDSIAIKEEENKTYRDLVKRAQKGDNEAEKQLLIHVEETNNLIKERLKEEDFLSIVEVYFVPDSEKSANYSILGDIIKMSQTFNQETDEKIYIFTLEITGTKLEVVINEEDLIGMPSVGMRFMGQCWLQGKIFF